MRGILPPFPTGEIEDTTLRQLLTYAVFPLLFGAMLMAISFRLKILGFLHAQPPGWRITLMVAGVVFAFLGFMLIVLPLLAKLWHRRGWSYMNKGSWTANLFVFAFSTLLLLPVGFAGAWITGYDEALEIDALRQYGVPGRFRIERGELVSRKNDRYSYYFHITDKERTRHELEVRRGGEGYLAPGDSVDVIYLPANPEFFREIE